MSVEERGAGLALGPTAVSCAVVLVVSIAARGRGFATLDAMLGVVLLLLLMNSTTMGVPRKRFARVGLAASYGLCCLLVLGAVLMPLLPPSLIIPYHARGTWDWCVAWVWAACSVVSYVVLSWPGRWRLQT
jgi:hypothetical protein